MFHFAGQPIASLTENAVELVRLLRNFLTEYSNESEYKFSEKVSRMHSVRK